MASRSETGRSGQTTRSVDLSWDNPDFETQAKPKQDLKKLFLVIGLGGLSWVATYVGMLELIEANMGDLPLVHKAIIGFSVAMLMTMVVWLLDQMFSDIGWFTRMIYAAGYVFLTVISVGFGFGFYWKVLESRGEASRSAESAVGQVQTSLHAAMTRLEQLQGTLDSLTTISTQKADNERNTGLSCPNSKPGDGPRRKMRDEDAGRFKFASDFVKGRIGTVKSDIAALEGDLMKIAKDDKSIVDTKSGTRNEFMKNLGRKLDLTVTGFNAFRTDPQLKQIRIDLNERADKVTFVDTKGGTYTCPDSQLTTALKGVVRAIDELPQLEKPKIATVEGSEAVVEAFRRLTATFYGALSFKLPPSPEELRELQKKAVQSVEAAPAAQARLNAMADQAGLSKRDYVPLAIAIFVDLCLLFVSMGKSRNRLQGLVPKMREAERGPVIQILSRFNEIHRDAEIRENFEMFRHVVFDFHGDYYAAIPLNAPYRPNPHNGRQMQGYGVSDAQELLQEAHLLANLFASFEKEKIFTRVHSPLLSTKTVQKRLRRQGSKFANAEAFRIYRFKDGAWSEIILGAVMGAARRVEADKRRRRVEEDLFRGTEEPSLDVAPVRSKRQPIEERDHDVADAVISHPEPYPPRYGAPINGYGHHDAASSTAMSQPPHDPGYAMPRPMTGTHGAASWGMAMAPQGAPGLDSGPMRVPAGETPPFNGLPPVQPFYPANASAQAARAPAQALRDLDPALPAGRVANNNTVPSARASAVPPAGEPPHRLTTPAIAENVVLHPAVARPAVTPPPLPLEAALDAAINGAGADSSQVVEPTSAVAVDLEPVQPEKTVTVEAVRETVTYRVPVSEAALPQSLLKAAGDLAIDLEPKAEEALPRALPPPLPEMPAVVEPPAVIALPEAAAEHSMKVERQSWDAAHQAGWRQGHDSTLNGHQAEEPGLPADDTRTMALRLRPAKREG